MANGDECPRMLALIDPGETEVLLDNELPQWDMSEEIDHLHRISELVGDWPMEDKDNEVDPPLQLPYRPPKPNEEGKRPEPKEQTRLDACISGLGSGRGCPPCEAGG